VKNINTEKTYTKIIIAAVIIGVSSVITFAINEADGSINPLPGAENKAAVSLNNLPANSLSAAPTPIDQDVSANAGDVIDFVVQYQSGTQWMMVTNGNVMNNNKVWRKFTFKPVATEKIRVWVTGALYSRSRIVELEAWGGGS